MTPRQYQRAAMRTIGTFDNVGDRMAFCAMEIMSESGEVANLTYKHLWQGHELDATKIMLELGDVMWGVAAMSETIGVILRMPFKQDWVGTGEYRYSNDRVVKTALRLGRWAGLLCDAVVGYLSSGEPNDIARLDPLVDRLFTQLCSLADCFHMTPQQVMDANIAKLQKRYPDGFSPTASIARVDTESTPGTPVTPPEMVFRTLTLVPAGAQPVEVPIGVSYRAMQLPDGATVYSFDAVPQEIVEPETESGIPADYADSAE